MVLGTAVDSNVMSYPVLVIMKEQGIVIERGEACPQPSGEAKLALSYRVRWSQPSVIRQGGVQPSGVEQGGASPQLSGEARPVPDRWARWSQPLAVGRGGASP